MTSDDQQDGHSTHSVTYFIQRVKDRDQAAAEAIWRRYFERLIPLARARLKALSDRSVDEEDILLSVFDRFFRAAGERRFARLEDRDDLWQILLMLTERKVADQYRKSQRKKRGSGAVANEATFPDMNIQEIQEIADREPGPEFIASFNDHLGRALARLGEDRIREIALLKLEGYENQEIAGKLNTSLSSVERKLRIIRERWADEFA